MPDARSAIADLISAGNDLDALAEAIQNAGFLDEIPGEDRQKLRGKPLIARACSHRAVAPFYWWGEGGWGRG